MSVPFVDDSMKVIGVHWSAGSCTRVVVQSKRTNRTFAVEFDSVAGLRMLDELDLAGIWLGADKQILGKTWLFEVASGGWLDLESGRDDFYTKHQAGELREYLVAGYQECVSILSESAPRLLEAEV